MSNRTNRTNRRTLAHARLGLVIAWLVVASLAAGCASLSNRRAGNIEVDPERGFTITETTVAAPELQTTFDEALKLLRAGKNEEGIDLLEQVVAVEPELTVAHINLGIAHARNGDLDGAESSIRTAISLNPKHPVAHNELGIVYRKMGRFEKARSSYENALDAYPDFHFARRNLAVLCDVYLSDVKCAVKHYEIYAQLVPEDEAVAMWLADLRNRMEK